MADQHDAAPGRSLLLERLLFFSDAVFAIVLTLLALDLHLPRGVDDAHLPQAVAAISGSLTAFTVSFALVGVFWMVHVVTLRALAEFDWVVAAVNLVFLFTVTLTPFASALVGRFGTQGEAWRFYCLMVIAISLASVALIAACHRDEPRLLHSAHHGRFWFRTWRAATPGLAFGVGLALSFAGLHGPASLCWLLVPPLMLILRLWFGERAVPEFAAASAKTDPAADS